MPVPGIEQIQQCHHLVDPGAARGNPTQAAVVKTLRALGLKAIGQRRNVRSDMPISAASSWLNSPL